MNNLPRRNRPVRDAVSAVGNSVGTAARVVSTVAELADIALLDIREDMLLDNYENETERLVTRKRLEAQRAQLLGE